MEIGRAKLAERRRYIKSVRKFDLCNVISHVEVIILLTFNLAQENELVSVAHDVYALLQKEQVVSEQASESPKPDTRGRKKFILLSSRSL